MLLRTTLHDKHTIYISLVYIIFVCLDFKSLKSNQKYFHPDITIRRAMVLRI